jgi:CRISPR locus-related DNA-binding protein
VSLSSAAVILLGFDITHALLTFTNFSVQNIVCVLASIGGTVDPRSELAYSAVQTIAKLRSSSISISKTVVEVTDMFKAVKDLGTLLEDLIKRHQQVIFDLSGGPRLLTLEALLAFLKLRSDKRRKVRVVVLVEGKNEFKELRDVDIAMMMMAELPLELSEEEKLILNIMEAERSYRLSELQELLAKKYNRKLSKAAIYRMLKSLEARGLVAKVRRGVYRKIRTI